MRRFVAHLPIHGKILTFERIGGIVEKRSLQKRKGKKRLGLGRLWTLSIKSRMLEAPVSEDEDLIIVKGISSTVHHTPQ